MIIINADDWGRSIADTNAAHECFMQGKISSATAMTFMADSERAAALAKESGMDIGLHLNFDLPFDGQEVSERVREAQKRTASFLSKNRYSMILYHPFLREEFKLLFQVQHEEFVRLYGKEPSHFDGHHHMHLCTNLLIDSILPPGIKVRTTFSFAGGEKNLFNSLYRSAVTYQLKRRFVLPDLFFALSYLFSRNRLAMLNNARSDAIVEIMTHPAVASDKKILQSDEFADFISNLSLKTYSDF